MATTTNTTEKRFIRLPKVRELTTLPSSAIYAAIAAGTFPKQIKLGARAVAWLESDVQAWIDARVAESAGGAA